jgi:hypothetical protein
MSEINPRHQSRKATTTHEENQPFRSTRIESMEPDMFDPSHPRIGRRESEPHSLEVSYLHDVLSTNFPQHHTLLDLHHYFRLDGEEIDIQFDLSFFIDASIPYTLSSYRAAEHQDRVPELAINILSKSTWRADLGENVDLCRALRIPSYVVFAPFDVASKHYHPPFLRVYLLREDGSYEIKERRACCTDKTGTILEDQLIDMANIVPFRMGIEELEGKHEQVQTRYRIVLVQPDLPERLLSGYEREKQRADSYLKLLEDHGIEP